MRKSVIFLLLGLVVMSFLLFRVRYQVQELEEDVAHVERSIIEERESIHVLNAEWSYLTRPSRLQLLAEKHLGLKPATPAILARWDDIPMQEAEPAIAESESKMPEKVEHIAEPVVVPAEPAAPVAKVALVEKKASVAKPAAAEKKTAVKKLRPPVAKDEPETVWDALRMETSASGGAR